MADREDIEKVRQEIMRFRELLNVMRERLGDGERAYSQLFAQCLPGDMKTMKEKDLQWQVAEQIIDDLTPLRNGAMRARYDARELERAFEELYDIIATTPEL